MNNRKKESVLITEATCLQPGIYSMWFKSDLISSLAKPGQFVAVYTKDMSKLLPRPISICEINTDEGLVRIVYRIAGKGTDQFSKLSAGDYIDVLGPLGNGYDLEALANCRVNESAALLAVGGGIGIPPMLELVKQYSEIYPENYVAAVLGYRDKNTFLDEEFKKYCDVYYASDDGSIGVKGTVIDAIKEADIKYDVLCACGPTPMQRGLKNFAAENNKECYLSLEEKMACGIGACLACVCKSKEVDDHSKVHNKRICKDGPVFKASEIEI